jgi:fibronectin type 3 domain-containing protein
LTATPGNGQVALAWTAPASNGGSPITAYSIYRGTASGGETLLATVGVVAGYTDTGLTNGTTYYYQVAAQNAIGGGARSAELSAKPTTVPTTPRSVTARTNTTKGVTLTWVAPLSDGGAAVTAYRIYRSTTSGTETFFVAVGNVLRYVDTATTAGLRYYYQVSAVNAVGEGPRSIQTNAIAR